MVTDAVVELTINVVGPSPASYVNSFMLDLTSDIRLISVGPGLTARKLRIGRDSFVALSMTKTNAEKEYESYCAKLVSPSSMLCSILKENKLGILRRQLVSGSTESSRLKNLTLTFGPDASLGAGLDRKKRPVLMG